MAWKLKTGKRQKKSFHFHNGKHRRMRRKHREMRWRRKMRLVSEQLTWKMRWQIFVHRLMGCPNRCMHWSHFY